MCTNIEKNQLKIDDFVHCRHVAQKKRASYVKTETGSQKRHSITNILQPTRSLSSKVMTHYVIFTKVVTLTLVRFSPNLSSAVW